MTVGKTNYSGAVKRACTLKIFFEVAKRTQLEKQIPLLLQLLLRALQQSQLNEMLLRSLEFIFLLVFLLVYVCSCLLAL